MRLYYYEYFLVVLKNNILFSEEFFCGMVYFDSYCKSSKYRKSNFVAKMR